MTPPCVHRVLAIAGIAVGLLGCRRDHGAAVTPPPDVSRPRVTAVPIGTEHPVVVLAASYAGNWVALCQAPRDTNGDGLVQVWVDRQHGTLYGDAMEPSLALGDSPPERIDALVGAHPSGRYVAFVARGRLVVARAGAGTHDRIDLTALGADTRAYAAATFDSHGGRLAFARRSTAGYAAVLLDLETGVTKTAYESPHPIWAMAFEGRRRLSVYVLDRDTDGNGRIEPPDVHSTEASSECRAAALAVTTFRLGGDEPTEVRARLEPAVHNAAPEQLEWARGCVRDGRQVAVHVVGGPALVAAADSGGIANLPVGPLEWVPAPVLRPCEPSTRYEFPDIAPCATAPRADWCRVVQTPYGSDAWLEDDDYLWIGDQRVSLVAPGALASINDHTAAVSGSGAGDVWAVPAYGSAVRHWDGRAWTEVGVPGRLPRHPGVLSDAPSRAWIYGDDGRVLAWDGHAWTPLPAAGTGRVTDAATVDGQLWLATADGDVHRWRDGGWTATRGLPGAPVLALWLAGADDAWAATGEGEIWRFSGARWRRHARLISPALRYAEYLLDIAGADPHDVWASTNRGGLVHWNGTTWTRHDTGTTSSLVSILAVSPDRVLVATESEIVRFRRPRAAGQ